jgi:Domain of unknown function (DUF1730)
VYSRAQVTQMALDLGFDLVGFAPAGPTPGAQAFLDWLSAGFHGEMRYLEREPERRLDPQRVLPGVRTIMMVGASYDTLSVPQDILRDPSRGRIARYAWGADYHDVLTPMWTLGQCWSAPGRRRPGWASSGATHVSSIHPAALIFSWAQFCSQKRLEMRDWRLRIFNLIGGFRQTTHAPYQTLSFKSQISNLPYWIGNLKSKI